jgi:hypothetical protein
MRKFEKSISVCLRSQIKYTFDLDHLTHIEKGIAEITRKDTLIFCNKSNVIIVIPFDHIEDIIIR